MFALIIIGLLTIALIAFVKHILHIRKINSALKWTDGPKPLPLLGNILDIKDNVYLLTAITKFMKQHNGIYKLTFGLAAPDLYVTDLELLKYLMNSNKTLAKSEDYDLMHSWIKFGLLTSSGTKWQHRRKIITPSFHFQILEEFIDIFNSSVDVLIEKLQSRTGKDIDIYPYITLLTMDIICESAMGIKVDAQLNANSEYVQCVREMGKIVLSRFVSAFKRNDYLYQFSLDAWKERRTLKVIHGMTAKVIKNRRAELKKQLEAKPKDSSETGKQDDDSFGDKKRTAFLDTLINATFNGESLSDEAIGEEVDTFMFEIILYDILHFFYGHDTTSSAITFTLYALSKHADIQAKAYEEIREIFGDDKTRGADYQDLQNMKYLEMVIKETMRLYTTVPFIGRSVTEDFELDGRRFPSGLNVMFCLYSMHRNPDIYPDPLKFDPERFWLENQADRHPYAFVPFSAGPRNCIGQKFAMLEMKSTISKILRHYELKPVENFEPILAHEITLKSQNGVLIQFEHR